MVQERHGMKTEDAASHSRTFFWDINGNVVEDQLCSLRHSLRKAKKNKYYADWTEARE
jgi:hypothetical protein